MFEYLKEKQVILVTGPQRSGTRLIAKAIAHDTGHTYIDEVEIKVDSTYELFWIKEQTEGSIVVQCPGLCYIAYLLMGIDGFFMVMCMRDVRDIIISQERIGWGYEWLERLKYPTNSWKYESIAQVKYANWEYAREFLLPEQYLEIQYEEMKDHPLWVPKEDRQNWGFSQTEIER